MASDFYTYTGQATQGWFRYRDAATGSMLVAEPGGTYQIVPLEFDLPVPPGNQWIAGTAKAAKETAAAAPPSAADTNGAAPPQAEGSGN